MAVSVSIKDRGFNIFSSNMIKPPVIETEWSTLLARRRLWGGKKIKKYELPSKRLRGRLCVAPHTLIYFHVLNYCT